MEEGDLVLVDAAAELGGTRVGGGYASDITRTWPCSGTFSSKQRDIHNVVNAQVEAGIAQVIEGSSFTAASRASAETMLGGLLDLGLLQDATIDELYSAGIHSLFMPHSLGHSVGIDVHDGGNINPFAPGMVVTVEPGALKNAINLRPGTEPSFELSLRGMVFACPDRYILLPDAAPPCFREP